MTSEPPDEPTTAFVWIWLPGATDPVVCGRLDDAGGRISFTYGRSYLARDEAVAIYGAELPLRPGPQFATSGDRLPLCIDDSMPDSWGRRLIHHRLGSPTGELGELVYLLSSGSDRIGALDFQPSPDRYVPRDADHPSLDDLAAAAGRIERGEPLDDALEDALLRGTSIGGARPKALLDDGGRPTIAKFSSTTDLYPVVQGEYVAMALARRAGLDVADVALTRVAGRHALLVERFDRSPTGHRRLVVSALTVLGLTPFPDGRYATYVELANKVRARFTNPDATLRELFARICFNILCGNSDDHGRNHAAFVDGHQLTLAPAYDLCPQARSGRTSTQAMAFGPAGERESRLEPLVAAAGVYHLREPEAREVVDLQVAAIREHWDDVCDEAELTATERDAFWQAQFLNPYAFER